MSNYLFNYQSHSHSQSNTYKSIRPYSQEQIKENSKSNFSNFSNYFNINTKEIPFLMTSNLNNKYNNNSNTNKENYIKDYKEKNNMIKSIYNKTNKLNIFKLSFSKINKEKEKEERKVLFPSIHEKISSDSTKNDMKKQSFPLNNPSKQSNQLNLIQINDNQQSNHSQTTVTVTSSSYIEKTYDITDYYNKNNYYSGINSNCLVREFSYSQNQNKLYKERMEDMSLVIENYMNNKNYLYLSLFDGHGGSEIAKYCKDNLSIILSKSMSSLNKVLDNINNVSFSERERQLIGNIFLFLKSAFLKTDENSKILKNSNSGSTALLNFIVSDNGRRHLFTANLGDTSSYIINTHYIKKISTDHLCNIQSESIRILSSNGFIYNNRVNGELIVTRAFGDHKLKAYGVIADPSIHHTLINDNDTWLVMGSDGVWDVVTESDLKEIFGNVKSSDEFTKALIKLALLKGSKDNISCVVVKL